MKTVVYRHAAAKALRQHRGMASRVMAKIDAYATNPDALANVVTWLVGRDEKRLRVGDFRVLFYETSTEIVVLDVGPRASVYD